MNGLHESDSPVILENNLVRCLRRLKGKERMPNASDMKYRQKLLKALSVFYKSINKNFEGSKRIMSKA